MIFARKASVLQRLRYLRAHGMSTDTLTRHRGHAYSYNVSMLGYNYRMDELRAAMGLVQEEAQGVLIWRKDDQEHSRWVFVQDPSQIEVVREVFNSDQNASSPACFVVVRQNDPSDDRGEVLFDIFRLNPTSYLWHFHRVYTPPGQPEGAEGSPR